MKKALIPTLVVCPLLMASSPGPPLWWTDAGVSGAESPNSPATIGQIKHMATELFQEMLTGIHPDPNINLPSGPSFDLSQLFPAPPTNPTDEWYAEQRKVANIGQLKHVGSFFYEQLNRIAPEWVADQLEKNGLGNDWPHSVPWNPATSVEENYSAARIGHLKMVFSLRLREDADADGIPDLLEYALYGDMAQDGTLTDFDGDGRTDADELLILDPGDPVEAAEPISSPFLADTDGDGIIDPDDSDPMIATSDGLGPATALMVLTPLK